MRRLFPAFLVLLLLAGCGAPAVPEPTALPVMPRAEPREAPAPAQTEPLPESHYINNVYPDQLRQYYTALLEQWPGELYREMDRSPLGAAYSQGDPLVNVGFSLQDLDGDGLMELLIGAIRGEEDCPAVFELWTAPGEEPELVFSGSEEDLYFLEREGEPRFLRLIRQGQEDAVCYRLNWTEGTLKLLWGLRRSPGAPEETPWRVIKDDDLALGTFLGEEEAQNTIADRLSRTQRVKYYPFYLYTP